jgi:hypothetical protein
MSPNSDTLSWFWAKESLLLPLNAACLEATNTIFYSLRFDPMFYTTSTGTRGTDHPLFSNFLFTNLFSIKFLYFFIISSLFPYFNLFVSIFIQSYVNIKLHVSTLYRILIIHLLVYQQTLCFSVKSIEITITRVWIDGKVKIHTIHYIVYKFVIQTSDLFFIV